MVTTGLLGSMIAALSAAAPLMLIGGLALVALALLIKFVKHVWDGKSTEARFLDLAARHPNLVGTR